MELKRGKFVWENGVVNGDIIFEECKDGMFLIEFNPSKKDK